MPVKLEVFEHVNDFSAQDKIDVKKIYTDHPQSNSLEAVESLLSQSQSYFYAARFNDRILGGAVIISQNDAWEVSYLCVRKITRRRHVAHDLLRELVKLPKLQEKQALTYTLLKADDSPELAAFLMAEGFRLNNNVFSLAL